MRLLRETTNGSFNELFGWVVVRLRSFTITLHAVVILFLMVLLFNVGVIMVNLFDHCTSYRFREPIKPCYQYQETWRP